MWCAAIVSQAPLLLVSAAESCLHESFSFVALPFLLFPLTSKNSRKMSTAARKRLMRDFKRLQNDPPAGVSGSPLDNNVMVWQAVIFGYVFDFCIENDPLCMLNVEKPYCSSLPFFLSSSILTSIACFLSVRMKHLGKVVHFVY